MRKPITSSLFRKNYKKLKKSGRYDMKKLQYVMEQLIDKKILSKRYQDHSLGGKWKNYRECHIEGDWFLIYKIAWDIHNQESIIFVSTDNHSNIFS